MIKIVREYFALAVIILLALYFRVHNLEGKMTFEWDQARDFEAVSSMLKTGKPLLLGPIVRGSSGGFYLGPLYYYLITPLYYFSNGNPLSLTVLSIGLDIIVICMLYVFIKSKLSHATAVLISTIYSASPLIINNSYIPWNVSLIPLWTLLFLIAIAKLSDDGSFRAKLIVVFLSSLTLNIHLSLVPIAAIFLLINWKSFTRLSSKQYFLLMLAAFIPVSTLIVHDIMFHFENTILLKRFLFGVGTKSSNILHIAGLIVEKYGYTVGRLLTGEPYTIFGLIATVILVGYGLLSKQRNLFVKYSLATVAVIMISLLIYRDSDFAEYYFTPTFIPLLILLAYLTHFILTKFPKYMQYFVVFGICLIYLFLGVHVRASASSPYSLSVKKTVINTIKELGYPVEFRTNLPRERNTGFDYLMSQMGVVSDRHAQRKAYVYEVGNMEVISPPEARSIILERPIQAFKLIVFSN